MRGMERQEQKVDEWAKTPLLIHFPKPPKGVEVTWQSPENDAKAPASLVARNHWCKKEISENEATVPVGDGRPQASSDV